MPLYQMFVIVRKRQTFLLVPRDQEIKRKERRHRDY